MSRGVRLSADEAVAITKAVRKSIDGLQAPPFPSLDRIAIDGDRVFLVDGQTIAASRSAMTWLGALLHGLLWSVERQSGRIPAGLKIIATRAAGHKFGEPGTTIDTAAFPRFSSVDDLMTALARYMPPDPAAAIREVFERARHGDESPAGPSAAGAAPAMPAVRDPRLIGEDAVPALTFADLRPRREAAGVTLAEISASTKVPLNLLEDLERGDVSRWPGGLYARAHLREYAEFAGLPPDEVLGLVLDEVLRHREQGPVVIENPNWATAAVEHPTRPASALIPVLLVIATLATFAFGGPIVRYFRNPAQAQTSPTVASTSSVPAAAQVVEQARPTIYRDPDTAYAPPPASPLGTTTTIPPPSASVGPAPPPPTAPMAAPAPPRPVGTAAGAGRIGAVPPGQPLPAPQPAAPPQTLPREVTPRDMPPRDVPPVTPPVPPPGPDPEVLAALRAERAKMAASLEANGRQIAQTQQERTDVETLLENAQTEEDAAAFRKRLDEIGEQLASLVKTRQRLSDAVKAIDKRMKLPE